MSWVDKLCYRWMAQSERRIDFCISTISQTQDSFLLRGEEHQELAKKHNSGFSTFVPCFVLLYRFLPSLGDRSNAPSTEDWQRHFCHGIRCPKEQRGHRCENCQRKKKSVNTAGAGFCASVVATQEFAVRPRWVGLMRKDVICLRFALVWHNFFSWFP